MILQRDCPVTSSAHRKVASSNLRERSPRVESTAGTFNLDLLSIEGLERAADRDGNANHCVGSAGLTTCITSGANEIVSPRSPRFSPSGECNCWVVAFIRPHMEISISLCF